MSKREKFNTRTITIDTAQKREITATAVSKLPLDRNIEVVIREVVKARKLSQQQLMFAGPLRDIAEQAWHNNQQYPSEMWHETYKILYLPEDEDPDLAELVKDPETWRKWGYLPKSDKRECIGSTTGLTIKGYSRYLEQIHADGAGMGVLFHASPNEMKK